MADLPVITFIQERLSEADPTLIVRQGTAYYDLFVEPQEFMLQPFITAMETILTGESVGRILALPNPDQFDTGLVDNLVSNVFVTRDEGELASGIVQVLYAVPIDIEYPAFTAEFDSNELVFFNNVDVVVSAEQMSLQTSGNFFYVNFPIQAQLTGDAYNLQTTSGVTFVNDTNAVVSSFISAPADGQPTETNTEVLNRAQNSIGVRDLETIKGINAIIQENFTYVSEIQAIGMGDPEMQRDIIYNAHVGGNTDLYLKTPQFQIPTNNFVDVEYDFTREVPYSIQMQMTATDFSDPASDLNTPNIVSGSVVVTSNVIPTAAEVISQHIPSTYTISPTSPVVLTGASFLINVTTITVSSTANVITGLTVTGSGIQAGTIVISVPTSTTFVISLPTSSAGPSTLSLFGTASGINLNLGQWIKLHLDNNAAVNIKIAGATPTQTQRFEIINAINAAVGQTIASEYDVDKIIVESQTVGLGSLLEFTAPNSPRTDGTTTLFPVLTPSLPYPISIFGDVPEVYVENVDYMVEYADGQIARIPGGAILSGAAIAAHPGTPDAGAGSITTGSNVFSTGVSGAFSSVSPGDLVYITSSTGITPTPSIGSPATYIVSQVVNTTTLNLLGLNPTGNDSAVQYYIISQQVVEVTYQYNPVSIDVGPNVLLANGSRGIRPGRENFTITDVAFVDIISIQLIDPITLQGTGTFLNPPGGFGSGGFGDGGFGIGSAGDYQFIVNVPPARFSAWEDSVIVFNPEWFGSSFAITYYAADEIAAIHAFCINDGERVTGASVLAKAFIPSFVDMTVNVRPNASNINTPSNATLVASIQAYIQGITATNPVDESDLTQILVSQGLLGIQLPFTMNGTIINPDGSTTIVSSVDQLSIPNVTLPSQTNNYTTPRITQWYPRNIVITGVS